MVGILVDMSRPVALRQPMNEAFHGLGGRALIANYIMGMVKLGKMDPMRDSLGGQNPLLFCTGVFAGASCSICLHILADGAAVLEDAMAYRGCVTYEFVEKMQQQYGKNVAVAVIGPSGERCYKAASIQITEADEGWPSRAAARGGLGALMGAKGLKAVVIEEAARKYQMEYANRELFKSAANELNQLMIEKRQSYPFHNFGTVSTLAATSRNNILPAGNFSGEIMSDIATKVGAGPFLEKPAQRGGCHKQSCQSGCVIQCSTVYNDKDGKYLTSGFEYETVALLGPNCRTDDLDAIAFSDSMMCLFAFSLISSRLDLLLKMYVGLYGGEFDITRSTIGLGVKTLLSERAFNQLNGFTADDGRLPAFLCEKRNLAGDAAWSGWYEPSLPLSLCS